jgi:prephenate dehydrogenase
LFERIAIVGIGLIGGSFGLALKRRRPEIEVVGITRREATLAAARAMGAVDRGSMDPTAAAGADLVFLATPVCSMGSLLRETAPHLAAGAVVTDAGSTKSRLCAELPSLLPEHADYVGGHPMAGCERFGVENARADLFEGATWVLTPSARGREENVARLEALIAELGARPVRMECEQHDVAAARISHLPHVAAAALAECAPGPVPDAVLSLLAAGGFRDTTRIAASSPEMWRDICLTNADALLDALDDYESALGRFRTALEQKDGAALEEAFASGREARLRILPPRPSGGR